MFNSLQIPTTLVGNDVTTVGQYGFPARFKEDVRLVKVEEATQIITPLTVDVDFTLQGVDDSNSSNWIYTLATAIPTGFKALAYPQIPFNQLDRISQQTGQMAETIERAIDRIVVRQAQQQYELDRAVKISVGNSESTPDEYMQFLLEAVEDTIAAKDNAVAAKDLAVTAKEDAEDAKDLAEAAAATAGYNLSVTGSVLRTVPSRLKERASIRDFGAVGDGTTDDTDAFTAAVAALNAGLIKTLYIPEGNFVNNGTHTITITGAEIVGHGINVSTITCPTAGNIFTFRHTNPESNLYYNSMRDLSIVSTVNNPSSGCLITLNRVKEGLFQNLILRNVYQGMKIAGGGENANFDNVRIFCSSTWSAVATGSFLLSIDKHNGGTTTQTPYDITFSDCFLYGSSSPSGYLENCLVITSADNIYFNTCKIGCSDKSGVYIKGENDATTSIQALKFNGCSFDTGGKGSGAMQSNVVIGGTAGKLVQYVQFTGCTFQISAGDAINVNYTMSCLQITGCQFFGNGKGALNLTGVSDLTVTGCSMHGNNTANGGSSCMTVASCSNINICDNTVQSVTYNHPIGVSIGASVTGKVSGNVFADVTQNLSCDSATGMIVQPNYDVSATTPLIASASTITLPLGYQVVRISGTTTIDTINIQSNITGYQVVLMFQSAGCAVGNGTGNVNLTAAYTSKPGSNLTLVRYTNWREAARGIYA